MLLNFNSIKNTYIQTKRALSTKDHILFLILVSLVVIKVLWGYWVRDLTPGDTSSYFQHAVKWYMDGQVNIVWSPLYTAYFGSWLNISEQAHIATFLHRLGLILLSTGLVAWLAWLTLPRIFALLLVVWWVAMPIHYDTLYEVHLFGALPMLVMAVVSIIANNKWRGPALLSIALISTALIRNEYIIAVIILIIISGFETFRNRQLSSLFTSFKTQWPRYGALLLLASLLIAFFYSVSYKKGAAISEASEPKHTLNMCQVYTFGYQQRNPDWKGSPWHDCSKLMQEKFDLPYPTLRQMITANPHEVITHFLWNLSLTKAGLEVLLFNATTSKNNPDYAPVFIAAYIPSVLLGLTLLIFIIGTIQIFRHPGQYKHIKSKLIIMAPLLIATVMMAIAVIITQRPRPSYLLGAGVLYVWLMFIFLSVFVNTSLKISKAWFTLAGLVILLLTPNYQSLPLNSKRSHLTTAYQELYPHAAQLCLSKGILALNDYAFELNTYLCSLHSEPPRQRRYNTLSISSLDQSFLNSPTSFVSGLEAKGATALIIDQHLFIKQPKLIGCTELRDLLIKNDWKLLTYSELQGNRCIAAFTK